MKIVFLDRDGVINRYPGDFKYVTSWNEFQFLDGAKEAIKKLNDCGYKVFIVSNQAGVSKGIYSKAELDNITENMLDEITKSGGEICETLYCTHREEENCACRKPKTGLIDLVLEKFKKQKIDIDLSKSYFIGDTIRDIQAGKSAGLKTILVFSGKEKPEFKRKWQEEPDYTAQDLKEAVDFICRK
ncbi:MAG: HAD family hydrolase [Candidatus Omnitrophica bacterium]|nr:HAD family hydrolase [Candidatus Omnitrophota bacterium]